MLRSRSWFVNAGVAGALGCAAPAPPAELGETIVIGVTTDLASGSDFDRIRVVTTIDGAAERDVMLSGRDPEPPRFPMELPLGGLTVGARVEVLLEVYRELGSVKPYLTRAAATDVVAGRKLLLRAPLERECIPAYRLGSERNTPECSPPETCIATMCSDPYVPTQALEDYQPGWATEFADACKPLEAGEPEVILGQGFDAFAPLAEGEVVPVESGPQGGYHLWVSLRMRNLHQSRSVTSLTAEADGFDAALGAFQVGYSYAEAPDGSCELLGLRYQVFFDHVVAEAHFDEPVRLSVIVTDVSGGVGYAERSVIAARPP